MCITSVLLLQKEQVLNSLPNYISDDLICDNSPIIRVKPPRGAKIYPVSFSVMDTASSSDVCLEKYITYSQKSLCKDVNKSKKASNTKPKNFSDKNNESPQTVSEKTNSANNNPQVVSATTNTLAENCSHIKAETDTCTSDNTSKITAEKASNVANNTDEDFYSDLLGLCGRATKSSDDNSYINVLTPPKSVPEIDQPVEPYFTREILELQNIELQKSVLFSSLQDPPLHLPTLHSDSLDMYSADVDYDPLLPPSKSVFMMFSPDVLNNKKNCDILNTSFSESNLEDILFNSSADSSVQTDNSSSGKTEQEKNPEEEIEKHNSFDDDEEDIYTKTVRRGWTADEAGYLTFGELYLMVCIRFKKLLMKILLFPEYQYFYFQVCLSFFLISI